MYQYILTLSLFMVDLSIIFIDMQNLVYLTCEHIDLRF